MNLMTQERKREIVQNTICVIVVLLTFIMLETLFYKCITGQINSDFLAHIDGALDGYWKAYSLAHVIIKVIYKLPHPNVLFSTFITTVTMITSWGCYLYLKKYTNISKNKCILLSISLLFVCCIYVPVFFPHRYVLILTNTTQPYHNTTYILMRMFAVFCTLYFLKIWEELDNNDLKIKDCIIFSVLLTLCNFSKPSFFLSFAPVALVLFVVLLIKKKGKNFLNLFKAGCFILLSMPVMLIQTMILYAPGEDSSIIISFDWLKEYVFNTNFFINEFCNLLFPLVVFVLIIINIKKIDIKKEMPRYCLIVAMYVFSHAQQLIMTETGPRSWHGNYSWGVFFFGFLLFLESLTKLISMYKNKIISSKMYVVGMAVFGLHILNGLLYINHIIVVKDYML